MKYLILLLLVGCSTPDATQYQPNTITLNGNAFEMQNKINTLRQSEGLLPLQGESKLMQLALGKATQMDKDSLITHSGFNDRYTQSGCTTLGECLSFNYQAVSSSFTAYVNSKSHQKTLVNPNYTHLGYAKVGKYECILLGGYSQVGNKTQTESKVVEKYCIISNIER